MEKVTYRQPVKIRMNKLPSLIVQVNFHSIASVKKN